MALNLQLPLLKLVARSEQVDVVASFQTARQSSMDGGGGSLTASAVPPLPAIDNTRQAETRMVVFILFMAKLQLLEK